MTMTMGVRVIPHSLASLHHTPIPYRRCGHHVGARDGAGDGGHAHASLMPGVTPATPSLSGPLPLTLHTHSPGPALTPCRACVPHALAYRCMYRPKVKPLLPVEVQKEELAFRWGVRLHF